MIQTQFVYGPMLMLIAAGFTVALVLGLMARAAKADAERAKLFEMGYFLPRRASRWPQALFCTAMGLGVPITALGFASGRSSGWNEAWVVACVISVAGIVGATIVAAIVFSRVEPSGQPEPLDPSSVKPAIDPDALDFAGRLGRN